MSALKISNLPVVAGMLALFSATLMAAPPQIIAVRQVLPPHTLQQLRMQMLSDTAVERLVVPVKRYEKLELRVDLQATYQNPYDPDEIDLWAEFTAPSGKTWKIWGFYNASNWSSLWMVRFEPDEIGAWRVVVKARDKEGTDESKASEIPVIASDRHGFL